MSTVLALAGKQNSGKSTIGLSVAQKMNWPYASFGDYVRCITQERALDDTRENWQLVGEELVRTNMKGFCEAVLSRASGWKRGDALVIDGVRHVEVNELLKELVAPSKYILTYIEVDEELRKSRLSAEGLGDEIEIEKIESHSTEKQVETILLPAADVIIRGDDGLAELIDKLASVSSDTFREAKIPGTVSRVEHLVKRIQSLSVFEKQKVLASILADQTSRRGDMIFRTVRFGDRMKVVAYTPDQERYIPNLKSVLREGTVAMLENEAEGTYEVFDQQRIYYVTMTPSREFAAILSSWRPDSPPRQFSVGIKK
jgi:dephospho-CoA kinase